MHCTIDMSMSGDIQELIGSDKKKRQYFFKKPSSIVLYILLLYITLQGIFSSLREVGPGNNAKPIFFESECMYQHLQTAL